MEDGREKQRGTRVSALQIRSAMRDEMRNQNAQLSQVTVVTDHEHERVRVPERDPGRNPKWSETRRGGRDTQARKAWKEKRQQLALAGCGTLARLFEIPHKFRPCQKSTFMP